MVTGRKISYLAQLDSARGAFQNAIRSLGLNVDQAFAYAYDHLELLLRSPEDWTKIAAYIALFKCAKEYGVAFRPTEDQFDEDVLLELHSVINEYNRMRTVEDLPVEMIGLPEDLFIINEKYLK